MGDTGSVGGRGWGVAEFGGLVCSSVVSSRCVDLLFPSIKFGERGPYEAGPTPLVVGHRTQVVHVVVWRCVHENAARPIRSVFLWPEYGDDVLI